MLIAENVCISYVKRQYRRFKIISHQDSFVYLYKAIKYFMNVSQLCKNNSLDNFFGKSIETKHITINNFR